MRFAKKIALPLALTAFHGSCAMAPGIGAAGEEAAPVALTCPQDHLAAAVGAARRVILPDGRMTLPQVGDNKCPLEVTPPANLD